ACWRGSTPTPVRAAATARVSDHSATISRTPTRSRPGVLTPSRSTSAALARRACAPSPHTTNSPKHWRITPATGSCCLTCATSGSPDSDIGFTGDIQFANVLRNLDADAAHPRAAGPGHWNDPDYLGPELGMTNAESQAQLSMWAIVAAPLILGSDPRSLSPAMITMLENRQVIAIDQDPLGIQGTPIQQHGTAQVWVKPLVGGSRAVALLNRGRRARRITPSARAIGLSPASGFVV